MILKDKVSAGLWIACSLIMMICAFFMDIIINDEESCYDDEDFE